MKIGALLSQKDVTISFEVFPPKTNFAFEPVLKAVDELSALKPDYMSVTYGAGGGISQNTVQVAAHIQNDLNVTALAHLTCVSNTARDVDVIVNELKEKNIENILALRGDMPNGASPLDKRDFNFAYQLIDAVRKKGDFSIGCACYPEGHIEADSKKSDLYYLKEKVEHGCDFLVTQMFFDNNVLYSFLYNALRNGITQPVVAGVMPVTNSRQIDKICAISGSTLTPKFKTIIDKFGDKPEALKQAGIAYATDQIVDLISNGVKGIHIYVMNKPDVAQKIISNLSELF